MTISGSTLALQAGAPSTTAADSFTTRDVLLVLAAALAATLDSEDWKAINYAYNWLTMHEAAREILVGEKIEDEDAMARAAETIVSEMGAEAVLIKGGHFASGDRVVDILYDGNVRAFRGRRLETKNTHGTGCTLSAAITAQLARGESLHAAVRRAIDYVHNAIASAPGLGSGHGPLNHLAEDS